MISGGYYLVAGASGAIGKALCREIVKRGGQPLLVGRSAEKLAAVNAELGTSCPIIADIDFGMPTDSATPSSPSMDKLTAELKGEDNLYGLAYAVGSITLKPLRGAKDVDFWQSYQVNVLGAVQCIQAALPALKKTAGKNKNDADGSSSIVLFSSIAASRGLANHSVVSSSKAAVEGLTVSLAAELAPQNIRVNCVAPSLTADSAMAQSMVSNENVAKAIAAAHPIARLGRAEDSARAAAFLLSSADSAWTTGSILPVDGGRSTLLK